MKRYRADLHVHTVLSPCAGVEMIPPLIVQEALDREIQILAITDHNATANIEAVQKAAQDTGLIILPGMELQTREEVHVLCLFDTLEQAFAFQEWVDARLPNIQNNADFFGEQFVVDETGDFIRREERLLLASAEVTLRQAWEKVHDLEGWYIPAHVNRKAYGLIAVLGLVPTDFPVDTLEISRHIPYAEAAQRLPQIAGYPLIQNGDVHYLDGFLGSTTWEIEAPTLAELRMAAHQQEGRSFKISTP